MKLYGTRLWCRNLPSLVLFCQKNRKRTLKTWPVPLSKSQFPKMILIGLRASWLSKLKITEINCRSKGPIGNRFHYVRYLVINLKLKMISSQYSALSGVLFTFLFDSCKTSQNVTFQNYLYEVISKFHVNTILWMLSFTLLSFWYNCIEQLCSCKDQRNRWKKNAKCLKDKFMLL